MKLRSYQVALNKPAKQFIKSKRATRAQVYAPTGAGKTVCFIELIKYAINQGATNIAIAHPRIALSQDQLRRIRKELGEQVMFTSFHSGGHIHGNSAILERNTTKLSELEAVVNEANSRGLVHVTLSTYHSFIHLVGIEFDLLICDEAHYMVQDRFYDMLSAFSAKKTLFYTATPITHDSIERNMLMAGTEFGAIIAQVTPAELIKPGYILAPLVQELHCITNNSTKEVDVVDTIARAYVEQYRAITKNGMPYAQMLVAARGVETDIREVERRLVEMWTIIKSELGSSITDPVDVYTVDANTAYCNGIPMINRDTALEQIKSSGKNVILIHYDTLAEGIDIDTLTGVCIMRSLSKSKFIQTIGRCARPYVGDLDPITREPRSDLYNPKLGIDKRTKPRCIVTLPVIDGKWISNIDGVDIAEAFIMAGYNELSTYLATKEDTATGTTDDGFELEDNDDDSTSAKIIEHSVRRRVEDLADLLCN
jgi:superfamily II DNA or RNA helicase